MPIHKGKRVVSAIIAAVQESSPQLVRYGFAPDTNIGHVQFFEPETKPDAFNRQDCQVHIVDDWDDDPASGRPQLPQAKYNVKTVTNLGEGAGKYPEADRKAQEVDCIFNAMARVLKDQQARRLRGNKVDLYKRQIELLEEDQKLGIINHSKISTLTKIHPPPGFEGKRDQHDQENFIELKKFANKYRDKLVIRPQVAQTQVDKLEGRKQAAAREDEIEFDYQNFKDSCLTGDQTQKWDPAECKKSLQAYRKNLIKNMDLDKQVHARVLNNDEETKDPFFGANQLKGEAFSSKARRLSRRRSLLGSKSDAFTQGGPPKEEQD